jgi:hypothetical protein
MLYNKDKGRNQVNQEKETGREKAGRKKKINLGEKEKFRLGAWIFVMCVVQQKARA